MLTTVYTEEWEEHTEYKEEIVIYTQQFPDTTHTQWGKGEVEHLKNLKQHSQTAKYPPPP